MRKFKSLETGAILVPNNLDVIKQLEQSEFYEEVKPNKESNEKTKNLKPNKESNENNSGSVEK